MPDQYDLFNRPVNFNGADPLAAKFAKTTDAPSHLAMGEKLKRDGLEAVEASNEHWMKQARFEAWRHVHHLGCDNCTITTDDLRRWADRTKQQPDSPNAWGSVFRGKHWKAVGYTKSTYGSNHARRITIWRWVG